MAKVWLRTEKDPVTGLDIPAGANLAVAMYGFRELGAEIIPYEDISEIMDWVTSQDIVLDYIPQCMSVFRKFGVEVDLPYYPEPLREFTGRNIYLETMPAFLERFKNDSRPYFIKPLKRKTFTGKVVREQSDFPECLYSGQEQEILVSDVLDIQAEWRVFIIYDHIVDVRPYTWPLPDEEYPLHAQYDPDVLKDMMDCFRTWSDRPAGCGMDICLTSDGRTLLMEQNDGYCLGTYGLPERIYAKLVSARWSQILNRADTYRFL